MEKTNIFIKLDIRTFLNKHLLSELGPERTHTLIGLALFLPEVYPSQSYLSSVLGISQPSVSKRIQDLSNFIFEEEPLITVIKSRASGRFVSNKYILGNKCGFSIFNLFPTPNKSRLDTLYGSFNKVSIQKGLNK